MMLFETEKKKKKEKEKDVAWFWDLVCMLSKFVVAITAVL
jgi:hypothetical protein